MLEGHAPWLTPAADTTAGGSDVLRTIKTMEHTYIQQVMIQLFQQHSGRIKNK